MSSHSASMSGAAPAPMIAGNPAGERWFRAGFSGRGMTGRVLWGSLGVVSILAACAAVALAWLEGFTAWNMTSGDGEHYVVNGIESIYFLVAIVASAGAFEIWKACHRGGLGFWRATVRPALMCMLLAVMGMALTFELCFATGSAQLAGIGVLGAAALGFLGLWYLRGPQVTIGNHDDYWNRAWSFAFSAVALFSLVGAGVSTNQWKNEEFEFDRNVPTLRTISVKNSWGHAESRTVPQGGHNHVPVAAGLMLLLAIGSIGEVRYRRRQAALAREVLLGQG